MELLSLSSFVASSALTALPTPNPPFQGGEAQASTSSLSLMNGFDDLIGLQALFPAF